MPDDRLEVARAGIIDALALIDGLQKAEVRAGIPEYQEEIEEAIKDSHVRLQEVLRYIGDAESDPAPNCGARNRQA